MLGESMVAIACGVCGSERYEVISSAHEIAAQVEYLRRFHARRLRSRTPGALADRADFTQDYATRIVRCAECSLVFRNPRPPDDAIFRAYAQDRYGLQRLASLFESQCALYRPKARALRRHLPPGSRVVEVGSFVGGFLVAGAEQGFQVLGVDPGEEVDAFCAERALPVFRGTLPDLVSRGGADGWRPGWVDCVAIWNAFDQLPDPQPTLEAAQRMLRPGGLLVLRVPNGECFAAGTRWMRSLSRPVTGWLRALFAWNNLLAFPYLHGYSLRTLDWLLSWHGLVRVTAVPDTLCRLSDRQTRPWAAWEEWLLKLGCRVAARAETMLPGRRLALAPWLDVFYRVPDPHDGD